MRATVNATDLVDLRVRWEHYREACFSKYPGSTSWAWSGAAACEMHTLLLSTMDTPGFDIQFEGRAVCLVAFGERHFIPLAQMRGESLAVLQTMIVDTQGLVTDNQREFAHQRFTVKGAKMPDGILH